MDSDTKNFLSNYAERYNFSPRALSSVLKVSRTIADIEGRKNIILEDVKEAAQFRNGLKDFINI